MEGAKPLESVRKIAEELAPKFLSWDHKITRLAAQAKFVVKEDVYNALVQVLDMIQGVVRKPTEPTEMVQICEDLLAETRTAIDTVAELAKNDLLNKEDEQ